MKKFKKQELKIVAEMLFTADTEYTAFAPITYKEAKSLKPGDVVGIYPNGNDYIFVEQVRSISVSNKSSRVEIDTDSDSRVTPVYKDRPNIICKVYKPLPNL